MRPTGSLESVSTGRCSKRNRSVTSATAATLGVTTRSKARAQQESHPLPTTKAKTKKTGEGEKKLVKTDAPKRATEKKAVKTDGITRPVSPKRAAEKKVVKIDGGCSKKAKPDGISQPESSKKGKTILEPIHDVLFGWAEEEEEEKEEEDDDYHGWTDSSAFSSPIRVPEPLDFRPHDPYGDSGVVKKKKEMSEAFEKKLGLRFWSHGMMDQLKAASHLV